MNHNQFRDMLLGWKGASICTIHAETSPPLKAGNPFAGITKRSAVNGVINWVYENSVNYQRIRENLVPDFSAFPRKWGKRIKGTPLVEHKGKYYLEMKVQQTNYRYYLGGQEMDSGKVNPWLRPLSASRQGVRKEVILRDYALENISCFIYGGEVNSIVP